MLVHKIVNVLLHVDSHRCDTSVNKGVLTIVNLLTLYTHLSLESEVVDKLLGSHVT